MSPRTPRIGTPTLAWLVTGMAMATLPSLPLLPPWQPPVLAAIAFWRLRSEARQEAPLPRPLRYGVALGIFAALAASGYVGFGLEAALPLFVALLWVKLLEVTGGRDLLMTCFLALFLDAGALLGAQSLPTMLWCLAAAVVIAVAAVRHHRPAGMRPRTALALAGSLLVRGLPLAALLFVALPRPSMQLNLASPQATSGISDKVYPGSVASVARSQEVAFRAEFEDGQAPPPDALYWRGVVLTHFDGKGWVRGRTRSLEANLRQAVTDRSGRDPDLIPRSSLQRTLITLQPHNRVWLFTLDCPVKIEQLDSARLLGGLELQREFPVQAPLTYRCTSSSFAEPRDAAAISIEQDGLDPRIRALAAELQGQAGAGRGYTERLVQRMIDWYAEGGFAYTLEPGLMAGGVGDFLFEKRRGFCGHFASAFAVVMNLAGARTRLVAGYRGGEANPHASLVIVRQAQAHAWCEVFIPESGTWRRVDPTDHVSTIADDAAGAVVDARRPSAAQRRDLTWWQQGWKPVRQYWDFLQWRWDRYVLGYDDEARSSLLARLGLDRLTTWLGIGAGALMLAGAMAWFARRRSRRRRTPSDRAAALWDAACALLAARGLPREPWEGPRDYAARVAAGAPALASRVDELAAAYVALRYRAGGGRAEERRLRQALRDLRR